MGFDDHYLSGAVAAVTKRHWLDNGQVAACQYLIPSSAVLLQIPLNSFLPKCRGTSEMGTSRPVSMARWSLVALLALALSANLRPGWSQRFDSA